MDVDMDMKMERETNVAWASSDGLVIHIKKGSWIQNESMQATSQHEVKFIPIYPTIMRRAFLKDWIMSKVTDLVGIRNNTADYAEALLELLHLHELVVCFFKSIATKNTVTVIWISTKYPIGVHNFGGI